MVSDNPPQSLYNTKPRLTFPTGKYIDPMGGLALSASTLYIPGSDGYIKTFDTRGHRMKGFKNSNVQDVGGLTVDRQGKLILSGVGRNRHRGRQNHRGVYHGVSRGTSHGVLHGISIASVRCLMGSPGCAESEFRYPRGVAADRDGRMYVVDSGNRRIKVIDQAGRCMQILGDDSQPDHKYNNGDGDLQNKTKNMEHNEPEDDEKNDKVLLDSKRETGDGGTDDATNNNGDGGTDDATNNNGDGATAIDHTRSNKGDVTTSMGDGALQDPRNIDVDQLGDIYVTDTKQVKIYSPTGALKSSISVRETPQGDMSPYDVIVDGSLRVFVSDWLNHCVHVFQDGGHIQQIGSRGSSEGCFNHPSCMALYPDGDLAVCDRDNNRVQVFSLN